MSFIASIIRKAVNFLHRKSDTARYEMFLAVAERAGKDSALFSDFVMRCRTQVVLEHDKYPSALNNGYLHIDKAISVLRKHDLQSGYVIIDAGAANGLVSGMFAGAFPGNTILSFEPIKSSYDQLLNTGKVYSNMRAFHTALGKAAGSGVINISERITSSSVYAGAEHISDSYFAESLREVRKEEISIARIDDILGPSDRVALLKMDVQGAELSVLEGAVSSLKRTGFVLTELMTHSFYSGAPLYHEIDAFLRSNGFVLLDIIPSIRRDGRLMEFDALYGNPGLVNP